MLDITILKTAHGGDDCRQAELRARKLIPYVENCDVFSIESALVTEKTAKLIENVWAGLLKSKNISRQDFAEGTEYFVKQEQNPTIRAYLKKAYEYVFRNRKPLYCAERWPDDTKANIIRDLWDSGARMLLQGLRGMAYGDDSALRKCYEGSKRMHRFAKGRDVNVGKNFSRAEAIIRETYQQLAGKDPIRLCVQTGAIHRPEFFSPLKVSEPVLLTDDYQLDAHDLVSEMMWTAAPFEDYIPLYRELAAKLNLKR